MQRIREHAVFGALSCPVQAARKRPEPMPYRPRRKRLVLHGPEPRLCPEQRKLARSGVRKLGIRQRVEHIHIARRYACRVCGAIGANDIAHRELGITARNELRWYDAARELCFCARLERVTGRTLVEGHVHRSLEQALALEHVLPAIAAPPFGRHGPKLALTS